ncbi:hypothetical protein CONPUDRAFT_75437 [Coniophora puteana RWD-64-598 SS2]|uniref:Uncharacterized protein n=1 Tax=Coniophora puteana (strain RWD-64-598) TaxID=741705 RepID=A0A5M3MG43_CONPW|nr:uncharacterized protein CONPUDRAFT_75437 [Coniophora puteana RWD-64-598 SS2]EIW77585.1 hypothetical protein CONPUDRAFT_75437 [Coniophora puteana RWD-64-598 SS2]
MEEHCDDLDRMIPLGVGNTLAEWEFYLLPTPLYTLSLFVELINVVTTYKNAGNIGQSPSAYLAVGAPLNAGDTFGPVVASTRLETENEVALANDTDVGRGLLQPGYGAGVSRRRLRLVSVCLIPFGGVKESGFGHGIGSLNLSVSGSSAATSRRQPGSPTQTRGKHPRLVDANTSAARLAVDAGTDPAGNVGSKDARGLTSTAASSSKVDVVGGSAARSSGRSSQDPHGLHPPPPAHAGKAGGAPSIKATPTRAATSPYLASVLSGMPYSPVEREQPYSCGHIVKRGHGRQDFNGSLRHVRARACTRGAD